MIRRLLRKRAGGATALLVVQFDMRSNERDVFLLMLTIGTFFRHDY